MSFGLGALDGPHGGLHLDAGGETYSTQNIVTATLIAAFGNHAGPAEVELGASIPFAITRGDRGPDVASAPDPSTDASFELWATRAGSGSRSMAASGSGRRRRSRTTTPATSARR